MLTSQDGGDFTAVSALYLYGLLVLVIVIVLAGIFVASLVIGAWGLRKAKREGRYCPDCGLWDDAVEVLIHRINEHERKERPWDS